MTSLMQKRSLPSPFSLEERPWAGLPLWPGLGKSPLGALDIEEDEDKTTVFVDLPGVKKDDIDVSYDNEHLMIRASRQEESRREDGFSHSERSWGEITRSLHLAGVDPDSIEASLSDGVLSLKMTRAKSRAKQIEIEEGGS